MKIMLGRALLVSMSALAACGPSGDQGTATTGNETSPAGPGVSQAQAALVGRWALDSSCSDPIVLAADGGFTTPEGDRGRWSLAGDRITLAGPASTASLRAENIEANAFVAVYDDGGRERMVRC